LSSGWRLLPLIATGCTFVLGRFYYAAIVSCTTFAQPCVAHPLMFVRRQLTYAELTNRMMWGAAVFVFSLLAFATTAVAVIHIWPAVRQLTKRDRWVTIVTVFAVLALGVAADRFIDADSVTVLLRRDPDTSAALLRMPVEAMLGIVDSLVAAVTVTVALAVGACAVPWRPDLDALTLRRAGQSLQTLLWLSALVLVAGVFQVTALYTWAFTVVMPSPGIPGYLTDIKQATSASAAIIGILHSASLCVIFLPVFALNRGSARRLAARDLPEGTEEDREKWLTARALHAPLARQLANAVALLAPVLAGAPGALLLQVLSSAPT
jgi:hypothetical protein